MIYCRVLSHNDSPIVLIPESPNEINEFNELSNIPLILSDIVETNSTITQTDDIPQNKIINDTVKVEEIGEKILANEVVTNIMGDKAEEIPSFSEWAQKKLEEADKILQTNLSKNALVNGKCSHQNFLHNLTMKCIIQGQIYLRSCLQLNIC